MGAKNKTKMKRNTGKGSAVDTGEPTLANRVKWIGSMVLICCAVGLDYYFWSPISEGIKHHAYADLTVFYYHSGRVLAWLLLIAVTAVTLFSTSQGKTGLSYLKKARDEMYRVTWPTRQEAMKMTLVLVCIVCVVGLFLFAIDLGFMNLINMALP